MQRGRRRKRRTNKDVARAGELADVGTAVHAVDAAYGHAGPAVEGANVAALRTAEPCTAAMQLRGFAPP